MVALIVGAVIVFAISLAAESSGVVLVAGLVAGVIVGGIIAAVQRRE